MRTGIVDEKIKALLRNSIALDNHKMIKILLAGVDGNELFCSVFQALLILVNLKKIICFFFSFSTL